jgi:tetratricopeptide (TPR) repeat protein
VEGETENETWAGFYSGSAGNLSDLITSIAGAVATQVLGDLTADQQARLARVREADPQAYSEYLAGRVLTRSRTPVAVETAIQHFLRAIEIDSTYAPAVAMLSGMYSYQGFYGIKAHTEVFPLARRAAHRAMALDSTSAQAHGAMAFIHRYDRAWALEGQRWERAIRLEPQDHDLHAGYAYWLQHMGRLDEAIEEFRIALEIEPLHMQYKKEMARQLYFARRFDEAIEWHRDALRMGQNDFGARIHLALTLVQVGRMDEAVEETERAYDSATQPRTAAIRAYVYAHAGREKEARALLAQTEDEEALLGAVPRAWAYGALGEIDRAFPYLDQAFENRSPWLFQLNDAAFDPLRDDPRFDDLLVRLGLPVGEGG